MELLLILTGLIVGSLCGYFYARFKIINQNQGRDAELLVALDKSKDFQNKITELEGRLEKERSSLMEITNQLATARAERKNLEEKLSERFEEQKKIQEHFALEFKNLANDILEEKSKKFTEQNRSNLFDLLKPLGERISEFEKKVDQTHKDAIEKNASLFSELKHLKDLNLQMSDDAKNLTRALKGDTRTQGAWGELILESILEKSGLEKGREYAMQAAYVTSEGRRQQPDVIVHLPNKRHIIIDSKVSLTAYDGYVNAESDQERNQFVKTHLQSIRQHMRLLSDKEYQKNYSDNGLDFVIMFIPLEPAYLLAIQYEIGLYEEAINKRVIFVSPTLLIPTLQLIKNVWKQEYQNQNVIDIARKSGALYDKFVGFTEDLYKIGQLLDSSKKYYEESMKKLSTGSGNMVRRVEELRKLGAMTTKSLDPRLVSRAEDQPDLFD